MNLKKKLNSDQWESFQLTKSQIFVWKNTETGHVSGGHKVTPVLLWHHNADKSHFLFSSNTVTSHDYQHRMGGLQQENRAGFNG